MSQLEQLSGDPGRQAFLAFQRPALEPREGLEALVNVRAAIQGQGGGPGKQTAHRLLEHARRRGRPWRPLPRAPRPDAARGPQATSPGRSAPLPVRRSGRSQSQAPDPRLQPHGRELAPGHALQQLCRRARIGAAHVRRSRTGDPQLDRLGRGIGLDLAGAAARLRLRLLRSRRIAGRGRRPGGLRVGRRRPPRLSPGALQICPRPGRPVGIAQPLRPSAAEAGAGGRRFPPRPRPAGGNGQAPGRSSLRRGRRPPAHARAPFGTTMRGSAAQGRGGPIRSAGRHSSKCSCGSKNCSWPATLTGANSPAWRTMPAGSPGNSARTP